MFDAADIAVFFSEDMPGHALATVGGVGGVAGLFRKNPGMALGIVSGTGPQLMVADTVAAQEGTAVTLGAQSYVVTEVQETGNGFITLILQGG